MKFAFIENRYKTIFWSAIAQELGAFGHSITWLVQNPIFSPTGESVYVIPFPRRKKITEINSDRPESLLWARAGDRYINYFGGNDRHYRYYELAIKGWLDREQPDIVIGESTLFHEFLVIEECLSRGIPYFHPSVPGYPGGRFSIYAYGSKKPLGNNPEVPSEAECLAMAEAIHKREKIPDYMIPPSGKEPERTHPLPRSIRDRLIILRGYLWGERFNTPSPWRKWRLDRQVKKRIVMWQQIAAIKSLPKDKRFVLYPLQMQPEANLDVWGQQFRDQAKLVRDIADNLPESWHLLVKANPKSKYELSEELMEVLQHHSRVSPIALTEQMSDLFQRVDLICTVTGTVAIECVLSRKPVVQFGPGIAEDSVGCVRLEEVADITDVISSIADGNFDKAMDSDRIRLVQRLYSTTFPGKISDPVNLPSVMMAENLQVVAQTLEKVAKQCV